MTPASGSGGADRFAAARSVADAVLYEGYVLYPYRASAAKNQVRFQWGVLVPPVVARADPSERCSLRTECVVDPGDAPRVAVRIRCLQTQHRAVESVRPGGHFEPVDALYVDGAHWTTWDEAIEHEIDAGTLPLLPVAGAARDVPIALAGGEQVELLRRSDGAVVGRAVRTREPVEGVVRVVASWADGPGALVKVAVTVANTTDRGPLGPSRADAVRHSLVAVHTLLAVDDGEFVSLLDPPDDAVAAVKGCVSEGAFPVLVAPDVMLSSPIILYDYPAVAPESHGDMYDATEIDEILALRVLTLTDEEKAEARGTDPRAAAIVDRCDGLSADGWAQLHGTMREVNAGEPGVPWWDPGVDAAVDPGADTVSIGGAVVGAGAHVVLRPSRRADAHDIFLAGMTATVAGVFKDVDGGCHVAVTLDDDPATEELAWQGRYLYFQPDELELIR